MFAASKSGSVDAKDPQFNYVTMLLHGNGTNGAQNNTFVDSSTNNFTITRNGNTTQGTFTPYGSNWSNYFNASTDKLTLTGPNLSGLTNFTFECWVYFNGFQSDAKYFLGVSGGNYYQLVHDSAGGISFRVSVGYIKVVGETSNSGWTTGTWYHVALVKNGNDYTIYKNGVSIATNTYVIALPSVAINYIGGFDSTTGLNAYMSNARITNTAVYTSSFTPSTTPLTAISGTQLLTCQSNRFVDNSTNAYALTASGSPKVQRFSPFSPTTAYSTSVIGGSGYFDGSGDFLSAPYSASTTQWWTQDFTIEMWVYNNTNAVSGTNSLCLQLAHGVYNAASTYWAFGTNASGQVDFYYYNGAGVRLTSTAVAQLNAWNHIAMVYTNSTGGIALYLNGASVATGTKSGTPQNSNTNTLNLGVAQSTYYNGYISNARIVNGTAVYTSSFTPPTAPLTAITNTSLLLSNTNAGILDNAMMNDLETVGNAQISTSVKKYGTGSMYFDGSGDRLYEPSNQNFNFGTGDFTIELWANPISQGGHGSSNNDCLVDFRAATGGGAYGTLYIYNSGASVNWYANTGVRITGGAISNSTWTHIAICRSSGNTRLFLNGVQSGSTYADSTNYLVAPIMIGEFNDGTGGGNFNGYIDDLRITKGVARYTASFTPPTAAFPDKG